MIFNLIFLQQSVVSFQGDSFHHYPQHEAWIFIVLLLLFLMFVVSVNSSYGWIVDSLKSLAKVNIRASIFSQSTTKAYQTKLWFLLFATPVINMYIYLSFYPLVELKLKIFAVLLAVSIVFLMLKFLITKIFAYTFFSKELFVHSSDFYVNILFFLGMVFYPLMLAKIYISHGINEPVYTILALIFLGIAVVFLIIKLFQFFYKGILDSFHIMLYLCTLEILPYFGLFQVYKYIVLEF